MHQQPGSNSATFAVSRSRGKRPGESSWTAALRNRRKEMGRATASDYSGSEDEDDVRSGLVTLHKMFDRKVTLHPDNTVVKSGRRIAIGEAEAIKVAAGAGIPAPHLREAYTTPDGKNHIRMDYVQGQPLDKVWGEMSTAQRKDIAQQLGEIVKKMRSVTPPPQLISACDGTEIRDTRLQFTYHSPPCRDEEGFNAFFLSSLFAPCPPPLREAFSRRLRTNHRIVLTHCDLTPRNILVKDGKIQGLVDWEDSGWYPEYWEYVKFFQRPAEPNWKDFAEDIFPQSYYDELVDFIAISHWQKS